MLLIEKLFLSNITNQLLSEINNSKFCFNWLFNSLIISFSKLLISILSRYLSESDELLKITVW